MDQFEDSCCAEGARYRASRRGFLAGSTAAVGGIVATSVFGGAFREMAYAADATPGDTVVILNLGGGIDGMSWVVPYADPQYYEARPGIAVPQGALLATDGHFGLNPAMAPLMSLWNKGKVGMLHAAGLGTPNRSHFDAAEAVGDADPGSSVRRGWVNRMIGLTGISDQFAAIGISGDLPESLAGDLPITTISGLNDVAVPGVSTSDSDGTQRRMAQIQTMWGSSTDAFPTSVRDAVNGAGILTALPDDTLTSTSAGYPATDLGRTMADTARVIKGQIGVRVVAVDYGAFDHHVDIGATSGSFYTQLHDVAASVAAFFTDLGSKADNVTLVTTSEFGRRLEQNSSSGLDHGWGNVMMAVGADVSGGYHASWPGLDTGNLAAGDLQVTTEYRQLLADVVAKRVPEVSISQVFPNLARQATGMIR
ncbi:DUF1501 domain-containing protein [Nocardioides mangrovicus]|uniref:DUF1501 domain-containing protein n=1 Tax=Nocardioides mangrovicus TaxID=2478913 RepID=A0A3L8P1B0_9ACTN|nr:DUF1501 domain-containing protein [Nocardioides mangrovicus]RLV48188.1 DUF1501 domain-containing protein [Nocardioides mangrovicus]